MNERDLDLIAALAEGRLEDETEARALIESNPEARAEYEAQRIAFQALSQIQPAHMSDSERAALRRDLWTELRSGTEPAKPVGTPWYYRWVSVAAGMFLVVGVGAVLLQNVGGEDSGDAFAEIAATEEGADQTIADAGGTNDLSEQPEADSPTEASPTLAGAGEQSLTDGEIEFFTKNADQLRAGEMRSEGSDGSEMGLDEDTAVRQCVEAAGLVGYDPVTTLDNLTDPPFEGLDLIVATPIEGDLASAPIAFIEIESCQVLYIDE